MFGNAHCILNPAPQTLSPTVSTILLCFYDFSPFYWFFSFSIATHSRFVNAHCTLKAFHNIITNSGHHPLFFPVKFPLFYCYFSFAKASIAIFESANWTLKTVPLQTRKIYPYHLSFTKYILRPCQHKNIFPRCDSDISGSTHQKYILTEFHSQNQFLQLWHRPYNFGVIFQGPCIKTVAPLPPWTHFPKVYSGNILLAGSDLVNYKFFAYLVYDDPVKLNVIPNSSLHDNTVFCVSTVPPLEPAVATWLDSVTGM